MSDQDVTEAGTDAPVPEDSGEAVSAPAPEATIEVAAGVATTAADPEAPEAGGRRTADTNGGGG